MFSTKGGFGGGAQQPTNQFTFIIDTTQPGFSNNRAFIYSMSYNQANTKVEWGDGTTQTFTANIGGWPHTYPSSGYYYIRSTGVTGVNFGVGTTQPDPQKVIEITQWGNTSWIDFQDGFANCINLKITATDAPILTGISGTILTPRMFKNCTSLTNEDFSNWDTANLVALTEMFANCTNFNGNISTWNTSKVRFMNSAFINANKFNGNISSWSTVSCETMSSMFAGASSFNQPINSWYTAKVTNMGAMFQGASAFNQNISSWNTANVTSMTAMFNNATAFNQNINSWNTANVTNMNSMFLNASAFNQNIGNIPLRVAGVTMNNMLNNCGQDTANYSKTLIGWANYVRTNSGPYNTTLNATGRTYSNVNYGGTFYANAVAARTYLVTSTGSGGAGWTITGDSFV